METTAETSTISALPKVMRPGQVPIKSWAPDLEGSALAQATNVSNLPFALRHFALMPDAHAGYGMPIGGVLFADRAVVPYAIGVDIGCGVALVETDLTVETPAGDLDAVLRAIAAGVPVGTATSESLSALTVDRQGSSSGGSRSGRSGWRCRCR